MTDALDPVRALVHGRPDLQRRLLDHDDPRSFPALVVAIAHDHGLTVSEGDVGEAVAAARRAWFERWI